MPQKLLFSFMENVDPVPAIKKRVFEIVLSFHSTSPYNNYRTTEIHCSSYDINSCSIRTRYNYCSAVLYIYCNGKFDSNIDSQ